MFRRNFIGIWIALMLTTAACVMPFTIITESEQVATSVENTVQAMRSQTQAAPTSTPYPTFTPLPTFTPFPTQTYVPPPTPLPCNRAKFVSETVQDNTEFDPGETFTKSWRLKNIGTCTWNKNYKLVFESGDRMSGPKSQALDEYVSPGETTDIVIDLEAPDEIDTYKGVWKLQSDEGEKFATVYAQIEVTETFAVTRVDFDADPDSYTGVCPTTIHIEADITTSAAGRVTYQWQRSDGVTSDIGSTKFTSAGTKTVQFDWELNSTTTHWVKLYIDNPNHQLFGTLNIAVECTP